MLNEKMEFAFNEQINKEFYSEFLYLAMKAKFAEWNLQGFVNWFDVQVQEERAHAFGMYDYVLERGGKIELMTIERPEIEGDTPVQIFEHVLRHEQYVTSRINYLLDVAEEVKDRAATSFLDWYLKEQVEEESNVGKVLATLKLIGDDKNALLLMDKDLATRVFTVPVIG
ncbi:MAG: ferritin [Candidatus Gastranaerophilales bacterium]|nr:ferritin [Candidatus Gastranaerophilales bacterium]